MIKRENSLASLTDPQCHSHRLYRGTSGAFASRFWGNLTSSTISLHAAFASAVAFAGRPDAFLFDIYFRNWHPQTRPHIQSMP